jgi:hypothetical protein
VNDPTLALKVAQAAIAEAEAHATDLSESDQVLGEAERAEVDRLRRVLALLIPGLAAVEQRTTAVVQ